MPNFTILRTKIDLQLNQTKSTFIFERVDAIRSESRDKNLSLVLATRSIFYPVMRGVTRQFCILKCRYRSCTANEPDSRIRVSAAKKQTSNRLRPRVLARARDRRATVKKRTPNAIFLRIFSHDDDDYAEQLLLPVIELRYAFTQEY